jgi:hypothetical protein
MKIPQFDTGRHQRETHARMIVGGALILLGVGGGLVWVLYGRSAAITAVVCLLTAFALFGLLWLLLILIERWVREEDA